LIDEETSKSTENDKRVELVIAPDQIVDYELHEAFKLLEQFNEILNRN